MSDANDTSRRTFLQAVAGSFVALGVPPVGSKAIETKSGTIPGEHSTPTSAEADCAAFSIARPDMGLNIMICSVSHDCDYPPAHELQSEMGSASWGQPSALPEMPSGPEQGNIYPVSLTFFEDESPIVDLQLGNMTRDSISPDGTPSMVCDSINLTVALGTAAVERWRSLGLSYQHWIARALLAPQLAHFPRSIDPAELRDMFRPMRHDSVSADANEPTLSRGIISLAQIAPKRPGYASWRAYSEIWDEICMQQADSPIAYLLTVHATKWLPPLDAEATAFQELIQGFDVQFMAQVDNLGDSRYPAYISLLAVLPV